MLPRRLAKTVFSPKRYYRQKWHNSQYSVKNKIIVKDIYIFGLYVNIFINILVRNYTFNSLYNAQKFLYNFHSLLPNTLLLIFDLTYYLTCQLGCTLGNYNPSLPSEMFSYLQRRNNTYICLKLLLFKGGHQLVN